MKASQTRKLLPLFLFSLCFTSLEAQDTLTVGEIYDFRIGDEFHYETKYEGAGTVEGWMKRTITAIDSATDSIVYTYSYSNSNADSGIGQYVIFTEALGWNIDDSIRVRKNHLARPGSNSPDSFWKVYSVVDTTEFNRGGDFVIYDEGLPGNMEPAYYNGWYAQGLGLAFRRKATQSGNWHQTLVYYSKGTDEWGTPLSVSNRINLDFMIFPNPSNGVFTVQHTAGNESDIFISISDMTGAVLVNKERFSGKIELNALPGVYFITVYDSKGNSRLKKLVVF